MNQTTVQEALDSKIHKTIQEYCDINRRPIRVEQALLAFDFLAKSASKSEIKAHKGEYLFLFHRLVSSLKEIPARKMIKGIKTETEQHATKIIELTDWFVAQRGPKDSLYKTRLKNVLRMLDEKNLPVPVKKRQEWQECLIPKNQLPSLKNCKLEKQPEVVYSCAFFGHRVGRRVFDKN